jgi:hypothetical protein
MMGFGFEALKKNKEGPRNARASVNQRKSFPFTIYTRKDFEVG